MAPSQRLEDDHMRQDHANYELSEPRGLDLLQEAVHHVREYECSSKDVEAAHAIISECLDHTLGTVVARFAFDLPEKLQDEHGRNGILDPCRITCDAIPSEGSTLQRPLRTVTDRSIERDAMVTHVHIHGAMQRFESLHAPAT